MEREGIWKRRIKRAGAGLGIAVGLIFLYGFMPADVEGNYQFTPCMCDSVNSMKFTNGKVVIYNAKHPPAELFGRYEKSADGSVKVYTQPIRQADPEELTTTFYPRKFLATGSSWWQWKSWVWRRPVMGDLARADRNHEITFIAQNATGDFEEIFYSRELQELRREAVPKVSDDTRAQVEPQVE